VTRKYCSENSEKEIVKTKKKVAAIIKETLTFATPIEKMGSEERRRGERAKVSK
jgi:hypothetical protein